jgi:hypothetical protein
MELSLKRPTESRLVLLLLVAIGWFYAWTVAPEGFPGWVSKEGHGYYNLLTQGFMKGHLSLDVPVDPFLAKLSNPWDPLQREGHGMHDASYYQGHYYIYFGVSPVVVLFLPFRLLTGHFIDERAATLLFAWVGLLAAAGVLRSIRARYFPGVSSAFLLGGILALGLVDLMPLLLRRAGIWEVPITCGYACFMIGLWATERALHSEPPHRWLALASAAIGLAVGARPVYLPAGATVLIAGLGMARISAGRWVNWRDARWRRTMGAALIPITLVGLGLALYNWLRFGNPLEFGLRYVMNGYAQAQQKFEFTWSYLRYGIRLYWLAPANWSHFFPYVLPVAPPTAPAGVLGIEDPYGILPNLPFVAWGCGWGCLAWAGGVRREWPRSLVLWLGGAAFAVVSMSVLLASFNGFTNRYMIDFVPGLALLAGIGLMAAAEARRELKVILRACQPLTYGLLLYSATFAVLASLRHNELLRAEHPPVYERLVHRWNAPSAWWDRWRHQAYGPVEMKVIFPSNLDGINEPLVVTGWGFLSDYLFVHYAGKDAVEFGLEHTSRSLLVSDPVKLKPGVVHTLRIDLGSLYPPAGHPYFDAFDPAQVRLRTSTLEVTVDGVVVLHRRAEFYDAVAANPTLGASAGRPGYTRPFSGTILSSRRLPDATVEPLASTGGPSGRLHLELTFPPFAGVHSEPLLSTGESGRGDLVFVRYLGPRSVAFGYDHWSYGGPLSAPVAIDPAAVQTIEIDTAAINPKNPGRLRLSLNGQVVFDLPEPAYACPADTVAVGMNAIHASTATEQFAGRILHAERLDH